MKPCLFGFLVGISAPVMLAHSATAQVFDESKGATFYETSWPIRKTIVPPPGQVSVDEYVLGVAKASNINFILDATAIDPKERMASFPASLEAIRGKWEPAFYNVLGDFCRAERLSRLRYDDTTYLMWRAPETGELARLIIASGKNKPSEPLPSVAELHRVLLECARLYPAPAPVVTQFPFGGGTQTEVLGGFFSKANLGDLSPQLRAPLFALAHHLFLRPEDRVDFWLSDDFWKNARVREIKSHGDLPFDVNGEKRGRLYIGGGPRPDGGQFPFGHLGAEIAMYLNSDKYDTFTAPTDAANEVPTAQPIEGKPQKQGVHRLTPDELDAENTLETKVSLQAKRLPLGEALALVSKQTKVVFKIEEGVPIASALLSAQVKEMPLARWMGAVARLYGLSWSKNPEGSFLLHASTLDPLSAMFVRAGRGMTFLQGDVDVTDYGAEQLEKQVLAELDPRQAATPTGVALGSLPEDLQVQIKNMAQFHVGQWIIQRYITDNIYHSLDSSTFSFSANEQSGRDTIWFSAPSVGFMPLNIVAPSKPRPEPDPAASTDPAAQPFPR